MSKQTLSPSGDDWTIETALDVEWAHAIAPKANILLVEAASDNVNSAGAPLDLKRGQVDAAGKKRKQLPRREVPQAALEDDGHLLEV